MLESESSRAHGTSARGAASGAIAGHKLHVLSLFHIARVVSAPRAVEAVTIRPRPKRAARDDAGVPQAPDGGMHGDALLLVRAAVRVRVCDGRRRAHLGNGHHLPS